MMAWDAAGLGGWLLVCFVAAGIGGLASVEAGAFYEGLSRPVWAPPAWLFGPAWTVLYVLMGVSAWLVWREGGFGRARFALLLFLVQLGVNALWSWLFFVWQLGAVAFGEIVLLWVLIVGTIWAFWRVRAVAGVLLLPYLVWVTYAGALMFVVWRWNLDVLG